MSSRPVTILLVDDQPGTRYTVARMLQKARYEVKEAATGAEALRLAAEQPDLIILDVGLPDLSGYEVCRRIKADPVTSSIVVLHLSASFAEMENRVRGLEGGADGYLTYPVEPAELLANVQALLRVREAERKAREQSEVLRVTLSSIGDGVITTDAAGVITFLNPVAQALTGWKPEEAQGQPLTTVFRIVNEQTLEPVNNPALVALQEGSIVGLANHTTLIARDGTERSIDDTGAAIKDAAGKIIGAVLVFRDITERRQLERASTERAAAARFLAAIVESSEDAIVRKSLTGIIQSWNAAAERLFGYTAEQAVGRSITMLIPPDRIQEEDHILSRIRAGERVTHFDTVRVRADGRLIPVGLAISPIRDEAGRIIGASKIARDITVRKRAENLLRLLSEAAQHLLAAGDLGELVRGLFEKIKGPLGVDVYFHYMLNETGDGLRLQSCGGIPEESADSIRCLDFAAAVCGKVATQRQAIHATHIQQSDEPMAQLARSLGFRAYACYPLLAEYRLLGTLSFASRTRDAFAPDELEFLRTVCKYVASAYERLLHVGQLHEADRRKDEFLATLAHELRNPLAPIRNVLELMRRADTGEDVLRQSRDTMERQFSHLIHLVDDLLDLSRITRDKLELRREDVPLASVISQAVEAARPLADAANHRLTVELPPEPITLHADPVRLAQVVSNLLTNACKYTDPGGRITLRAERQGDDVLVKVRDTGIGIAPDQLAHVFEIFAQVQSARERSQGGLGIGLALVKRLAELHGGSIEAHSEGPGRGSEFVFRLPVVRAEPQAQAPAPASTASRPAGRRILVVDDNRDSAESLALLLRMSGIIASTAHDGLDAIEAAEQFRPAAMLMDIGLPRLNGYDACRRIREQPWGRDILMVAMTGWGQDEDRRRSKEAGFDLHVVKPIDFSILMNLLDESPAKAP